MAAVMECARKFMLTNARLLERRIFEVCFDGAPPETVGRAVRAYLNPDGGLGHALEPDVRCARSQPLFIGVGLAALETAGCRDEGLAAGICDFLEMVSDKRGLVSAFSKDALDSPIASHWLHATLDTGINPTAELCAMLHYQGVNHPWLWRATEACVAEILENLPTEAHALLCAARLAEYLPDRALAGKLAGKVASALPGASFFIADAPVQGYGLTPLDFAPKPGAMLHSLFSERQLRGHLDDLLARRQPDGGWPITWDAPSPASAAEWRGIITLNALLRLSAYGMLQ